MAKAIATDETIEFLKENLPEVKTKTMTNPVVAGHDQELTYNFPQSAYVALAASKGIKKEVLTAIADLDGELINSVHSTLGKTLLEEGKDTKIGKQKMVFACPGGRRLDVTVNTHKTIPNSHYDEETKTMKVDGTKIQNFSVSVTSKVKAYIDTESIIARRNELEDILA